MFEKFPKTRPTLPPRVAEIYEQYYIDNRQGGNKAASLAQKMERWLHRHVASDVVAQPDVKRSTLELGAGTLNQFPHEPVNNAQEIEEVLEHFFAETKCKAFDLNKAIGLYRYYECSNPRRERCREQLIESPSSQPQNG
ncbi:hypothetical protein CVU37_12780 [candidate division BRC1 bacterium HGW-BRC1-1]|jgi:hypothetical protein|nr:MAG: hypothetical protein CVU37_12780 [candidate division BRC1 bacterium HGW-BRC1-1]